MTHIDDKIIELARTALSFEYGEEHFYRHAAEMTKNEGGKAMFLRLAEEETERIEDMRVLFGALMGKELWQQIAAEEAANAHPSTVIAEMEAAVVQRGHAELADDAQALRMAMELQRRIIHLFKGMAEHVKDPDIIKLADKMVQEECTRYDMLQAQMDSIMNVGIWLDSAEFRMDGKF
jgi:rubrerythrin